MTLSARRLGFGLSLLIHLGLLAGLWLWQPRWSANATAQIAVVPVRLAMFAAAPRAPAAAPVPVATPAPPEPTPSPAPVQPLPRPRAEASAQARPAPRAQPVERPRASAKPPAAPVNTRQPAGPRPQPVAAPAPVVPPAAPAGDAVATRMADRSALRDSYRHALLAAIAGQRFYPSRARRRGVEGQVRVRFRIAADGRIDRIELAASSGSALLDRAALQTVERLGRVAPLPPGLGLDHWDLVVPIDYRLR